MERLPESVTGFSRRLWRARVWPRDHAEQQRHVLHRAGHGPLHAEPDPGALAGPYGHATERRPQPHHVAEARGIAQRAAEIAAVGERNHAARERDGSAAARSAARLRGVIGIERASENRVERLR